MNSMFKVMIILFIAIFFTSSVFAGGYSLKRAVIPKTQITSIPTGLNPSEIIIKLKEGMGQPVYSGSKFDRTGPEWDILHNLIATQAKSVSLAPTFNEDKNVLDDIRQKAIAKSGLELADLTLYHTLQLESGLSESQRIEKINALNGLDIVEIAYFPPIPELATFMVNKSAAPDYQGGQYYLNPAPAGVDAYYAWQSPGGKGENVKVIDIEGNWIQTHEDLRGGTENFHIAGSVINDAGWWNHGTAVLGEIAADSNGFGMTGIAFNCDLGTVSIGSMSASNAIITAMNNSDTGDVILIELHAAGPHYNFEQRDDQRGYVAMEYFQDVFDAILQASAADRIIVEAAGNGAEDFDDVTIYGSIFDPNFRFSGAIMCGASSASHVPASFTNYGQRVDVHGFGTWDVYTLGYGDLYGDNPDNHYTSSFSGTSSSSPIVTGACAVLQSINLEVHQRVLNHTEMRDLLTTYSTPQAPSSKNIGPLPDLAGSVDQVVGVAMTSDTVFGWVPLTVNFSGTSGLTVDSWDWDFGDGNFGNGQQVQHSYTQNGVYDVSVEINSGGELRSTTRTNYIIALADTLRADTVSGAPGSQVEITISGNNTVDLRELKIPIEYSGPLALTYDTFSTEGCRTDYFEQKSLSQISTFTKELTVNLTASDNGSSPDLPPGDGPLVKLLFTINSGNTAGVVTNILVDGYRQYQPEARSPQSGLTYDMATLSGSIHSAGCCLFDTGNLNGDSEDIADISDLLYFVDYFFLQPAGPAPVCEEEGDIDGSGTVDISDLLYLVDYFFAQPAGPAPLPCYFSG